jgi:hypothetical protein
MIWKEVVVTYLKVLSQYCFERLRNMMKTFRIACILLRIEPGKCHARNMNDTNSEEFCRLEMTQFDPEAALPSVKDSYVRSWIGVLIGR